MFILKLSLELAVLAVLFLLIWKSLRKLFQKHDSPHRVSPMIQRVRAFIFVLAGLVSSGIIYWLLYSGFYLVHNFSSTHGALVVNHLSLLVPALIFGFYLSTMLNLSICELLGIDVTGRFLNAEESVTRRSSRALHYLFSVVTLAPAVLLLAMQFNVYIKIDDGKIYQRDVAGDQRIYDVNEIKTVSVDDDDDVNIHFADGAVMHTRGYSGNINSFLDNISR